MADEENTGPDLSFIPDDFKGEDGAYKVDEFKAHLEGLTAFKADADAAQEAMPKSAADYAFSVPEDHKFLDGFDPSAFKQPVLGEDGQPVMGEDGQPKMRDMTAADMIKADDPDLPLLQEAMLKHGAKPDLMGEIASIMANREIRGLMDAGKFAAEQKKMLGPNGQTRIDTVSRSLKAMLPGSEAKALLDSISDADALRGFESLLKKSTIPPTPSQQTGFDMENASPKELIAEGMRRQMSGK